MLNYFSYFWGNFSKILGYFLIQHLVTVPLLPFPGLRHFSHENFVPLFLNGPTPATFLFIFGLFKQTSLQFLQQIYVKKCPSSIQCWDLNPQPSGHESVPITTRPGLPPILPHLVEYFKRQLWRCIENVKLVKILV